MCHWSLDQVIVDLWSKILYIKHNLTHKRAFCAVYSAVSNADDSWREDRSQGFCGNVLVLCVMYLFLNRPYGQCSRTCKGCYINLHLSVALAVCCLFVCLLFFKNLHVLFYMALMLKIIFNKICNYYICAIYYFTVKSLY